MYDRGYVFSRPENGLMQQTRSIRIDLSDWETTSENRRILRKTEGLELNSYQLPFSNYSWEIGKMGKDFYETKFGDGTFSANKVKELLTSADREDFNRVLVYSLPLGKGELEGVDSHHDQPPLPPPFQGGEQPVGYCIAVETTDILHYSYPFYILNSTFNIPNLGMGMMIRAVQYAKNSGKQYIYLGSFQRPGDKYKLQFKGLEWFDGERWRMDVEELKVVV